jgi:hypothetical protein
VRTEFLQRRRDTGRKIRAAGSWHVAQCLGDQLAIRRHRLNEFATTVEANDADLYIAPR